ncbi:hypothetical protein PENTCL1PPCAC_28382, partial [Pristionchus entomophagus]
ILGLATLLTPSSTMMEEATDLDFLAPLRMELPSRNGSSGSNGGHKEEDDDADETETITGSVFGSESVYESVADEWRSTRLSDDQETIVSGISFGESQRVKEMEEEQERLNNSLFSLSTQFAQVQFRLKQIGEAKGDSKEQLLKELQEFAFKGCADTTGLTRMRSESSSDEEVLEKQRIRQKELIDKLKEQLDDLERYAYESGEGDMPSTVIIQKQKSVLENLSQKIDLNIEIDKMSQAEIQKQVEEALKTLINPFKQKEQLVEQLQTQITDLERFVSFLQKENEGAESRSSGPRSILRCPMHLIEAPQKSFGSSPAKTTPTKKGLFGLPSFSSSPTNSGFQKNQLKQTAKGRHYGDERARLQIAVEDVVEILKKYTLLSVDENHEDRTLDPVDPIDDDVFDRSEEEVVTGIRRSLCPSLRALLEHGMQAAAMPISTASTSTFGCLVPKPQTKKVAKPLAHIWDVILFFYDSRNGKEMSDAPVRKLSQSFQLDRVQGKSVTSKQILLSTIETIIASHARLKRSNDAQWKAFVSAALNQKRLPAWIRIIFRTRQVVDACYFSWSYVSRTGCEELYDLLDSLQKYNMNLPVDLALRPFEQMREAF